ncbi:hypothetical protein BaRGS_00015598 [Batillaria attramentaria]|uniref:Dehydrogenase/reductase SDR family member 7 n=1 Tax=Batillaria attramentaria TaxID=370345 RepID=A0ABD0L1X9_9CAEN
MKVRDLSLAGTVSVVVTVVLMGVIILTADSDLILWVAEHFGKSPASLAGQVVWITGASSGIGEELAYVLAAAGCRLVLSARRLQELNRVKQRCVDEYGVRPEDVLVLPLDVKKFDTHQDAVDTVLKHFSHIDILVNNAGRSQRALITNTSLDVDKEILEVNTLGPLSLTKAVLPHMIARQSGHIVVVSSMVGRIGVVGLGSYAASKHALHGWFDTLRMEVFQENISVSLVCPGPVFSDLYIHALTGKIGEELGIEMKPDDHRMATNRCSQLIAIAMANQLDEAWISMHPELSYLYLNQVALKVGARRLKNIREGRRNLHK